MKIIYAFTLLTLATIIISCMYTKPVCPEVPFYPMGQITGFETRTVSRIASYRTSDTPQQVITYFKDKLMDDGWSMVSETSSGYTAGYHSRNKNPPFTLSVVIASAQPSITDFKVHLTIGGPYNWNSWCQSLRP